MMGEESDFGVVLWKVERRSKWGGVGKKRRERGWKVWVVVIL